MTKFEVEKKFPVDDLESHRVAVLEKFGGEIQPLLRQSDQYLAHPVRDFRKTDEAFRIRSVQVEGGDSKVLMTYKGPRLDTGDFKTRKEIEILVSDDPESANQLCEMFVAMGFRPVMSVHKTRQRIVTRKLDWSIEFALDQVDGLGSYLEIEAVAESDRIDEAQDVLADISNQLKLSGAITTGYLAMLLEKEESTEA